MIAILFIVGSICGIAVGIILERRILSNKSYIGVLRVDSSDPDDGPYLFLEIATDPHRLQHDSYVKMKVSTISYISQD